MDDITRARMAGEIEQYKDAMDDVADAYGGVADCADSMQVIPAELAKRGIPLDLGGVGTFLIGVEIGAMSRVFTIEECHLIVTAVSELEPDSRYDVEEGPPLTERLLAADLLRTTTRHLRLTRSALQELIYELEDHYEDKLDQGADVRPTITELRARAIAGVRFLIDTLFPIYAQQQPVSA